MNPVEIVKNAAELARSKKASRLVGLDLRGLSDICDFQLVCSGQNERQTKTIAKTIEDYFKSQLGLKPAVIEGLTNGQWILMDYGSVNIHIFFDPLRDYYALEQAWPNAKFLKI